MSVTPPAAAYPPTPNPQQMQPPLRQPSVEPASHSVPPGPAASVVVVRYPVYTFHRFLAAFPVVFFLSTLITDIVYALTADMMWANFSSWMLVVGLLFGAFALVFGVIESLRRRRRKYPRRAIWRLRLGRLVILALSIVNALVHSRDAYTSVVPLGLVLSTVVAVLVLVTCWQDARLSNRLVMGVA